MGLRRTKSNKNPPIFSHEFFIQNHADIVSCVAMVFIVGLMFQATSPVASMFVTMQHNVTVNASEHRNVGFYTYGPKDTFGIFFYFLICIVIHAVIQEYILDKINRKMHLSKVKHSKFNESGQLLSFFLASACWGTDIIIRESYITNINSLWEDYPHAEMPFVVKLYFIIQISYWIHCYPELYFQKVKKDEMQGRIQYTCLYLASITAAYLFNFTRVALCMLVLHYAVAFVFHTSRLFHFAEKLDVSQTGFMIWNVLFVIVSLGTITLAVLTFWYGLEQSNQLTINLAKGNFNTRLIRIQCLAAISLLQAWMMWNFIMFHLHRMRERASVPSKKLGSPRKKNRGRDEDSMNEGDYNMVSENGTVRARARGKKN